MQVEALDLSLKAIKTESEVVKLDLCRTDVYEDIHPPLQRSGGGMEMQYPDSG